MFIFVTGRLKRPLHEWKLIYVAQFIIEVIEFGYKLLFIHIPAPKVSSYNRSGLTEKLNGPPEIWIMCWSDWQNIWLWWLFN